MNDAKVPKKDTPIKSEKKDYTLELPMIDLAEVIKFITEIHEKALEAATVAVAADKLGYSGGSSTPFYRRQVAARLFKLMSTQGVELTSQALDYLKPASENAKNNALKNSILAIPIYSELVQTHQGKRLNQEIIANGIIRKIASLSNAGAANCARVFISSLKTAEFLEADGTLKRTDAPASMETISETPLASSPTPPKSQPVLSIPEEFSDQEQNSFYLDKEKTKRVTLNCPLFLTQAEYDRICNWIKATWIIESATK
jgi:hypothetical protein